MVDIEQREIVADEVEHRLDRASRNSGSHSLFGRAAYSSPYWAASTIADGLQIVARVKALGDLADVLAERLAVPQVNRAGERIDLRARIVDIIFLGDAEARRLEHPGEAVADHGAAAMAHVQRPGRVGRHIFDIDALVVADRRQAVSLAFAQDRPKLVAPRVGRQPQVDEAWTRRSRPR